MFELQDFIRFVSKEKLFTKKDKLLLALSGGMDSMVLSHLLSEGNFHFDAAHCNFSLRGDASDGDEKFCRDWTKKLGVKIFIQKFDTFSFSKNEKVSIEMAARTLRYDWFESLRKKNKYDYIVIAHHLDDSAETIMMNLVRGTGLAGLHGIKPKAGSLVRPLLFTDRSEIEAYCEKHKLKYRTDGSNESLQFQRNKIRQKVMPVLKSINPSLLKTFSENIQKVSAAEYLLSEKINSLKNLLVQQNKSGIRIQFKELLNLKFGDTYLFEILKEYGFNSETISSLNRPEVHSGSRFYSDSYTLLVHGKSLQVFPKGKENSFPTEGIIDINTQEILFGNSRIECKWMNLVQAKKLLSTSGNKKGMSVFLDVEKMHFPLKVNSWKVGDSFVPFGMKGKKKLSDLFIDEKIALNQKALFPVLRSGNQIVAVLGLRSDERFKLDASTRKVLVINFIKNLK